MPKCPRTAEVSRRLVDAYVTTLRQHLPTYCIRQLDKLPSAQEHQLTRLRQFYPGTPAELLYLLQRVNGTCWETLQALSGSAPSSAAVVQSLSTSASATAAVTAVKSKNMTSTGSTATTNVSPFSPAAALTRTTAPTTAGSAEAGASPTAPSRKMAAPVSTAAGAAAKTAKATTAAAMASEAAAFIKSKIAKKVSTMAGPRPRRPLPHFVALPILGSTYTSCPYYLKSVEQMLASEQQFPPPTATLPDEGEGWPPSQAAAAAQPSSPSFSMRKSSLRAATAPTGGESSDAPGMPVQCSGEVGAAGTVSDSPQSAASGATLNTHSIASVYAGCMIVYGAPPPPPTLSSSLSTGSASNTAASYGGTTGDTRAIFATTPTPSSEVPCVVYVDPRIDIHASFRQWLAFADSVQPHVRGSAPKIPDADPAKVAVAAATKNAADSSRLSPAPTPSQACTPPPPPPMKQFAASRLYIDFKPVELHGGVYGQVIQFVHGNPDSFSVVASDFGEYLKYIMTEEYGFTEELEDDDDNDDEDGGGEGGRSEPPLTGPTPLIITTTDGRPLTPPTPSRADSQQKR
ncbi:hypothetical protein LPMP_251170 [Leishmania panamensis]|uniref:Knr4/Smi1-like domain-containing protein n=1 Tax=Leishmania panamensis TaxID=5679 RepID=A0A088RSU2_LEIPA|nr:hypothetical protein LPMP_251170 [Leishmania panamensis]AIN98980.1 hypothetical protein LPMP_251170 [Leishmania panamensis]